ncbi:MAG: hypothetical protein WCB27_11310 [Thermoguttaceae bacterium]|jgi:hypothetical protein
MSHVEPITARYTLVGRSDLDAPIRVAFRTYLGFGREIDRQLSRLVARWSHAASPWSRGMTAGQRRDLACNCR